MPVYDPDDQQHLDRILRGPVPALKVIRLDPNYDPEAELRQQLMKLKAEADAARANWFDPEPWLYEDGCRERVPVHEGTEDHEEALYRPRTYGQYKLEQHRL